MKCISKNILADVYAVNRTDTRYDFVEDPSILEWSYRLPLIIKQISGYDVILLQEVELKDVELLAGLLPDYHYYSHVISKKRKNIIGNMTLWKKGAVELIQSESNSTTLFTKLRHNDDGQIYLIGNAHFHTGNDALSVQNRCNQMRSTIYMLQKESSGVVLLAGDFNDGLYPGSETRDIMITAKLIITEMKETCFSNHNYAHVDQIVHSQKVEVEVGEIPDNRPIPDADEPSDHFPVVFIVSSPL